MTSGTSESDIQYRFKIYDSLLLEMIREKGGRVWEVFFRLFRENPPSLAFAFLDEKTRLSEEIRIFRTLPWRPFIEQLLSQHPFFFAVTATALLMSTVGTPAGWVVPLLGLLTSGIGHGSLDPWMGHEKEPRAAFYVSYLTRLILFLVAWVFFPAVALGFFIVQSADHFGEGNWIRVLRLSRNALGARLLAWTWGLFASLFSVLFHWEESLPIIQSISGPQSWLLDYTSSVPRISALMLLVAAAGSAWVLDRYERRATRGPAIGLPATLLLALSFMTLPLLPGFLCFFAYWHAWDSMRAQRILKGWSISEYRRRAFPFTALSIGGMGIAYFLFATTSDPSRVWQVLFIALGALTAAHAPVMKKFLMGSKSPSLGSR